MVMEGILVRGVVRCQAGMQYFWVFVSLGNKLVMKRTVVHAGTGIRGKMTTTLEDLDFADDLALISSTFTQIQKKNNHLNRKGKGAG